jgi:hypothetical protein
MATPAETEPRIEIPVLPSAAPAFNPTRRLYLSASLPANTRQELESALSDYLNNLEQPLYVFVNYSHDSNTENYLSRAVGSKPVGIPEGARYKVYTIINIPGSIMENVVGEAGEVTATTTKDGIVEGVMGSNGGESFSNAPVPCTATQINKLQQDFEARLAGKRFRVYGGGMEMYGFDGFKLETGHKEILTKAGICDLAQFDAKFKYVLTDPAHDIVRDVDVIYSTVNLWEGLQSGYNDGSVDWTSFVVPKITNQAELDNELNRLEAVTVLAKEVLPSGVVSENSYSNIANYIKTCREQPTLALENKFHLNQTIKGIYVGLHCYANYTYSFADLKVRPAIKASRVMWPDVEKAEQEGFAVPLSVSNNYRQYLAQYNTDKAYFFGEKYLEMVFVNEMLRGLNQMFSGLGTAWRTAINKQARLRMQVRRAELDVLKGQVNRMQTQEKLWTSIEEFDANFQGNYATYYSVKITNQALLEQVGVAFKTNEILEFHIKIPDNLQQQGIGSEIFKRAIADYSPVKVKGNWKKLDIYSGGESINLTIFKQKISEKFTPMQAAFETPTGKILKSNGFDGIPEIIKNTPDEVVILFNKK